MRGFAIGANGYTYKVSETRLGCRDFPCIVRTNENGYRETIIGFNGIPFDTFNNARTWAIQDQKYYPENGVELSNRKLAI